MRKELAELRQQYGELEAKYKKVVNELQEGKCSIRVILALKLTCINLKPQQPVITYKCRIHLDMQRDNYVKGIAQTRVFVKLI